MDLPSTAMARRFGAILLFCSMALALPAAEENLLPCGDAFYYPSKVRLHFVHIYLANCQSIHAMMAISSVLY
jgi:hypothetical protein